MPYVLDKDRLRLMPLILALKKKILYLAGRSRYDEKNLWGYLRHIAVRILEETALNAAKQYQGERRHRYWLIVDQAGVCMNIAFELYGRILSRKPGGAPVWFKMPMVAGVLPSVPVDAEELNWAVDALVAEIADISGPKNTTGGYDYDGAYCGMDNFSMTELAPRVLMEFFVDKDFGHTLFSWEKVEDLVNFWLRLMPELYLIARRYENEQIEGNGDVEVYDLVSKHLLP